MKHLSLAQDRARLTLVIPDQTALRAAAKAIRGYRFEGRNDGHAVFSFPAAPDVVVDVLGAFEPTLSPSSKDSINALHLQHVQLEAATAAKEFDASTPFEISLQTTPMAHQYAAINFAMARFAAGARGCGLLMEQGTGKSLVAVALANALYQRDVIRWAMVIAPNSLKGTWGAEDGEIRQHTNEVKVAPWVSIPDGTRAKRLQQAAASFAAPDGLNWVVTNYENFALNPRGSRAHRELMDGWTALPKMVPGLLVVDESTMVKNVRARRTQALIQLAAEFAHVLILTGTPVTSSPLDVFGQFEVMEPGSLGYHTYLAFDRAYAIRQRRRTATAVFEEVVGYKDLDDLEERVARLSYRARAADCLDLPDVVTKRIPVTLSPEQARIIKDLKGEMMAELEGGDTVDGRNILTRYLRMAQTIGGFVGVLDEEGRKVEAPRALDPNPKLAALLEYLEILFDDPEQKAVIFCQYRAEIEAICAAAPQWRPVAFYGGTSTDAREQGRKAFKQDADCRLFVAQYQTGSKGLTLVEAANVIFYSLTFSLEDFLQARKRVHRIGQTRTVTEAFLLGEIAGRRGPRQTLDHLIVGALQQKQSFADRVTGDHRKILEAL